MFTSLGTASSVTVKLKGLEDDSVAHLLTTQHEDLGLSPRIQVKKPHVIVCVCAYILVLELQTGESLGLASQTVWPNG